MVRFLGGMGCRAGIHELDRKRVIYFAAFMSAESFLCSAFAGFQHVLKGLKFAQRFAFFY